jgi:hypothetical protein
VQPLRDRSRRILIISRPELVDISRNFGLVALRKVLPVERRLVQFARGNLNFFPPLDHHTLPAGDFHMRPICLLHLSPLPWIHSCKHSANHGETPVTFTSLIPRSVARLSRPNMNCSISSGAGRRMVQSQWDRNFALALPHSTMSFCSNDLLFSLSACSLRISTKYSKRARCRFVAVQNHVDVYTPHVTKNWETEIVAKRAKNLFGPEGRDVVGTAIDNELESVGTI